MSNNSNSTNYDKYYANKVDTFSPNHRVKTRWDFAANMVGRLKPKSVLDFGCGDGALFGYYESLGVQRIVGVEVSKVRRKRAESKFARAVVHDSIQQVRDDLFEAIVCLDVLDHLIKPVEMLNQFYGNLCDGGVLIGSVPNFTRLDRRIKMLFGGVPRTSNKNNFIDRNSFLLDGGKLGYFSRNDIEAVLKFVGFSDISFYSYGNSRLSSLNMLSGTISWTARKC